MININLLKISSSLLKSQLKVDWKIANSLIMTEPTNSFKLHFSYFFLDWMAGLHPLKYDSYGQLNMIEILTLGIDKKKNIGAGVCF